MVEKIAYTDSWVIDKSQLKNDSQKTGLNLEKWMFQNAVHYEASDSPVGTELSVDLNYHVCPVVSAGHPKHEYTTGFAFDEILTQFGYV